MGLVIPALNAGSPAATKSGRELVWVAANMLFRVVSICAGACAQPAGDASPRSTATPTMRRAVAASPCRDRCTLFSLRSRWMCRHDTPGLPPEPRRARRVRRTHGLERGSDETVRRAGDGGL